MSDNSDVVRILAHPAAAQQVSRRAFLAGATATAAGGSLILTGCGEDAPSTGAASTETGPLEDQINMYTWGEYDYPKVMKEFTEQEGPRIEISSYSSNEELISKLVATEAPPASTSWFPQVSSFRRWSRTGSLSR